MRKFSIARQLRILQEALEMHIDLGMILKDLCCSYEFFRYRHNKDQPESNVKYLTPSDFSYKSTHIPAVSFFSGAGGLDLGFESAGFEHIVSFEQNPIFCETLRTNHPNWKVFEVDLSEREKVKTILHSCLGTGKCFEGIFHGGPPCQSFSIAANQRFPKNGNNFKRTGFKHKKYGTLLFDLIWYIEQFRPKAFLIENVPGLAEIDRGLQLKIAMNRLENTGYKITKPAVLNAADFGVPQDRRRIFILGTRNAVALKIPEGNHSYVPCYKAFEKRIDGLQNHAIRNHSAETVLRYMELKYGQRDKIGRVDRLDPYLPSKTVIAGGTQGGGRSHLHPDTPRTLSAREGARLQTFPDNYIFCGPPARQINQVGNAVPPLLAMYLARHLFENVFQQCDTSNNRYRSHQSKVCFAIR